MKKLFLPVTIMLLSAGTAFATYANDEEASMVPAYRIDPDTGLCESAGQICSTVFGDVCTWSVDNVTPLHNAPISATECGNILYKP